MLILLLLLQTLAGLVLSAVCYNPDTNVYRTSAIFENTGSTSLRLLTSSSCTPVIYISALLCLLVLTMTVLVSPSFHSKFPPKEMEAGWLLRLSLMVFQNVQQNKRTKSSLTNSRCCLREISKWNVE